MPAFYSFTSLNSRSSLTEPRHQFHSSIFLFQDSRSLFQFLKRRGGNVCLRIRPLSNTFFSSPPPSISFLLHFLCLSISSVCRACNYHGPELQVFGNNILLITYSYWRSHIAILGAAIQRSRGERYRSDIFSFPRNIISGGNVKLSLRV